MPKKCCPSDKSRAGKLYRAAPVLALLCVLTALAVPLAFIQSSTGTKWALLVGINQYDNEDVTPLEFAVADVRAAADALVANLGFPKENVFVMTSEVKSGINRPEHVNVILRLNGLAGKVGPNDTFLFYFSGHGYQREGGRHFLGTVNANPSSVETLQLSSLPMEVLREKMGKIRAQKIVFMIDACRNDPEKGRGDKDNPLTEDFSRSLRVAAKAGGSGQAGTAVLFACSAGERSYEAKDKGHGVFTHFLLEGMQGKAVEASGELTMASLGDYVQRQVAAWAEESQKKQRPDLRSEGAAKIVLADSIKSNAGGVVEDVDTVAVIKVTSNPPGARVFVDDGEVPGKVTPASIPVSLGRLKTKRVEIALEMQGHEPVVRNVTLERGKTTQLDLTLQRKPGKDTPPSAPVRIGQVKINTVDGADMVYIPAGTFQMGSNDGSDEKPVHTQAFWMYSKEVTNAQYRRFIAANSQWSAQRIDRSLHDGNYLKHWQSSGPASSADGFPVVYVSWHTARAYAEWAGGRLPTEAEWEYAARGGRGYEYGTSTGQITEALANYLASQSTKAVGSYPANPFGLYDMSGNVWEWCNSLYLPYPYSQSDGRESANGSGIRVLRGGSWDDDAGYLRAAFRGGLDPAGCRNGNGFRVVLPAGVS